MSALSPAQRRLRDLVLFRSPSLWRYWPYLPVLRRHPAGEGQELGVLYDARRASGRYGYSATVLAEFEGRSSGTVSLEEVAPGKGQGDC